MQAGTLLCLHAHILEAYSALGFRPTAVHFNLCCRALYAVLLHSEAAKSGKSPMFLSLVFKAMKGDVSNKRVAAFAKRLLQVAQEQQPAFTCGCLLMLSELLKVCCRCSGLSVAVCSAPH